MVVAKRPDHRQEQPARLMQRLGDPSLYESQLQHMADKGIGAYQDGLSLGGMNLRRRGLCKMLAREIPAGNYQLGVAEQHSESIGGKRRWLYRYSLTDRLVSGALASAIAEITYPKLLSAKVYSYQSGRSAQDAVCDFAGFIRAHQRQLPNVRERGVYVIRRDVQAYTDSIPVGPDAKIWGILRDGLEAMPDPLWALIQDLVRPRIRAPGGAITKLQQGLPTGTAICPVIFNLLLQDIDHQLARVENSFYMRFCDDLLFAHADASTVATAGALIEDGLREQGLCSRASKQLDVFFNGCGRSAPDHLAFKGTTVVEMLGERVLFDGSIALNRSKSRALLRNIKTRVRQSCMLLGDYSLREKARILATLVNQLLLPEHPQGSHGLNPLQLRVTNREQLRQLDFEIALCIATTVTGIAGVRAFRQLPYSELRNVAGLRSLVSSRNSISACEPRRPWNQEAENAREQLPSWG